MKKLLLTTLLTVGFTAGLFAQRQQEIGVHMNAEMGLMYGVAYNSNWIYKSGNERGAVRVRLNRTNLGWQTYSGQNYLYFNSGLFLGYEFRKTLKQNNKFSFYHGPEVGSTYNSSKSTSSYANLAPSVRYLLGIRYQINQRFQVGYEAPYSLTGNFYSQDGVWNGNQQISAGFLNENGFMTFLYCW